MTSATFSLYLLQFDAASAVISHTGLRPDTPKALERPDVFPEVCTGRTVEGLRPSILLDHDLLLLGVDAAF